MFLESEAGTFWLKARELANEVRVDTDGTFIGAEDVPGPTTTQHLLRFNDRPGISWTKMNVIDFYKRYLILLEQEETSTADESCVGWIEKDDGFWLENLSNVALTCILFWVQIEGVRRGTLKVTALGRFAGNCNFDYGARTDFPEMGSKIEAEAIVKDSKKIESYYADGLNNIGNDLVHYTDGALDGADDTDIDEDYDEDELENEDGAPIVLKGTKENPLRKAPVVPLEDEPLSLQEIMNADYGDLPGPPIAEDLEMDDNFLTPEVVAAVQLAVDEKNTELSASLVDRLTDMGVAHSIDMIRIPNVTIPIQKLPGSAQMAHLFANSNIYGQVALTKEAIDARISYIRNVCWRMQQEKVELEKEMKELDAIEQGLVATVVFNNNFAAELEGTRKLIAEKKRKIENLKEVNSSHTYNAGKRPRISQVPTMKEPRKNMNARFAKVRSTVGGEVRDFDAPPPPAQMVSGPTEMVSGAAQMVSGAAQMVSGPAQMVSGFATGEISKFPAARTNSIGDFNGVAQLVAPVSSSPAQQWSLSSQLSNSGRLFAHANASAPGIGPSVMDSQVVNQVDLTDSQVDAMNVDEDDEEDDGFAELTAEKSA